MPRGINSDYALCVLDCMVIVRNIHDVIYEGRIVINCSIYHKLRPMKNEIYLNESEHVILEIFGN